MQDIIATLLELQEIELVRQESQIVHKTNAVASLDDLQLRIDSLRGKIPAAQLRRYDQLRRNGLAVAQENAGICVACRLNVPKGELNRMRRNESNPVCPNCGRFLLLRN